MKLTDREWATFKIGKIFEIKKVTGLPIENYKNGDIPYISTSSVNNGATNFVSASDEVISRKGTLSIDPIKGKVFYHPYDFVGRGFSGASINLLYNDNLTEHNALFLATAIEKTATSKASYGYLFNGNRLKYGVILLPITAKGEPDYKFMEDYVKEIMHRKRQEYIDYAQKILAGGGKTKVIQSLINKKWKTFRLDSLFDIYTGRDIIMSKTNKGLFPVISHSAQNNGVAMFIDRLSNRRLFSGSNTISLADRGNFFATIQPSYFYVATRVKALKGKDISSKFILSFICNQINKQSVKFNYGHNACDNVNGAKIMLPVDDKGNPDYEYMEQYAHNKMLAKYKDYLQYANNLE